MIAKIHAKIGTACDITVTSATGNLWYAEKNMMLPISPAIPLKKCKVGFLVFKNFNPPNL